MTVPRNLPNPFYVLLMVVSTTFVFTCFCYLIAPSVVGSANNPRPGGYVPGPGAVAAAHWFDAWGTTLLGVEVVLMILLGVIAMLADRWFPEEPKSP